MRKIKMACLWESGRQPCHLANLIMYNVEIYTGKTDGLFIPEIDAAGSVVARLTCCIEGHNHKVFMATTPQLCHCAVSKAVAEKEAGMQQGQQCSMFSMSVTMWCDRSPI